MSSNNQPTFAQSCGWFAFAGVLLWIFVKGVQSGLDWEAALKEFFMELGLILFSLAIASMVGAAVFNWLRVICNALVNGKNYVESQKEQVELLGSLRAQTRDFGWRVDKQREDLNRLETALARVLEELRNEGPLKETRQQEEIDSAEDELVG